MIHLLSPLLLMAVLSSGQLSTLQGVVEKELTFQDQTEIFAGKFYLRFPDYLFLSIYSPLNQVIIARGDTVVIYFPDVGKAFRSLTRNPLSSELAGNLFQAQAGWDLSGIGYRLLEEEACGDTVLKHWVPGDDARVKEVVVRELEGRVVGFGIFDRDDKNVADTKYLKFLESGEVSVPIRIVSVSLMDGDTVHEWTTYRKLRQNKEIPDSIFNYMLPESVKVFEE